MNKLLQVILVSLVFASCRHSRPKPVNNLYVPSDEAEITTLAFNYIMPSDSVFKQHLLKYKFPASETDKVQQLKNQLDTARLYVFIADTLIRIPEDYLKKQAKDRHRSDKNMVKNMLVDSWAPAVLIHEKPGIFQLKNLAFTYNYQYTLFNHRKNLPPVYFNAGMFRMSTVFFNQRQNQSLCLY
jgi:hypothetical protein